MFEYLKIVFAIISSILVIFKKIIKEEKSKKEINKMPELKGLTREELDLICRALSDSMYLKPNYCFVEKYTLLLKFKEEKKKERKKNEFS